MSVFLDMLLIQVIVCFILDLSGFIESVEGGLSRMLRFRCSIPRPFSCSLCMGWWINIIYLIIIGSFTLRFIAVAAGLSFFSKNITGFIRWISEAMIKIETLLYRIIR